MSQKSFVRFAVTSCVVAMLLGLAVTCFSGCAAGAIPAEASVTPAKSEISAEREERRPDVGKFNITVTIPGLPGAPLAKPPQK